MDASFGSNGNQNNTISLDKNNETNNLNNISDAEVNAILNKYSWGAFSLGLIYGIFNKCWEIVIAWICLIVLSSIIGSGLISIVSLIVYIVIGFKARRWAAKRYRYNIYTADGLNKFKNRQRSWDIAGIIVLILGIILSILGIALGVLGAMLGI